MSRRISRRAALTAAALAAPSAALAACVPGTDGSGSGAAGATGATTAPAPAKAGQVTLTVWDQQTDGGSNAEVERLNREFEKKYPNVTIKRVARSFADLKTTLKLAISGANPPDVVQANQGYPDMVAFVRAGLLRPLDDYAGILEWNTRYPALLLNPNRVSVDGRNFGTGRLYGLSQAAEFVGVYYNRKVLDKAGLKPPATWGDLLDALPVLQRRGVQPIQFGNLDKSAAIHVFGMLQNQHGAAQVRNTVYGNGTFDTDGTRTAARTLAEWAEKEYIPKGSNGINAQAAAEAFGKGKGGFLLGGSWFMADLIEPMGDSVAVIPPPPVKAGDAPAATGGPALAWAVTARSKNPDVAAAYIDFITNDHASDVMIEEGVLPAIPGPKAKALGPDTPDGQLVRGFQTLADADGIVPYLDYATPTFYDTITAALQEVIGGKMSPEKLAQTLEKDYRAFITKNTEKNTTGGAG